MEVYKEVTKQGTLVFDSVPKVSTLSYVHVGHMEGDENHKLYRLVCPCGNFNWRKYSKFRAATLVPKAKYPNQFDSVRVSSLLCDVCKVQSMPFSEYEISYKAQMAADKEAKKEPVKADL